MSPYSFVHPQVKSLQLEDLQTKSIDVKPPFVASCYPHCPRCFRLMAKVLPYMLHETNRTASLCSTILNNRFFHGFFRFVHDVVKTSLSNSAARQLPGTVVESRHKHLVASESLGLVGRQSGTGTRRPLAGAPAHALAASSLPGLSVAEQQRSGLGQDASGIIAHTRTREQGDTCVCSDKKCLLQFEYNCPVSSYVMSLIVLPSSSG